MKCSSPSIAENQDIEKSFCRLLELNFPTNAHEVRVPPQRFKAILFRLHVQLHQRDIQLPRSPAAGDLPLYLYGRGYPKGRKRKAGKMRGFIGVNTTVNDGSFVRGTRSRVRFCCRRQSENQKASIDLKAQGAAPLLSSLSLEEAADRRPPAELGKSLAQFHRYPGCKKGLCSERACSG